MQSSQDTGRVRIVLVTLGVETLVDRSSTRWAPESFGG